MNLLKFLPADFLLKLRYQFLGNNFTLGAPLQKRVPTRSVKLQDKIIVLGAGIAGITALKELHRLGYRNVTLVTQDKKFGGKCVHAGCMMSETALKTPARLKEVAESLALATQGLIQSFGYPIHYGEVTEILGNKVVFADSSLEFDELIVATGNRSKAPPELGEVLSLEAFWELEKPSNLVIYGERNLASTSLAATAQALGHSVTLCFSKLPLSHLPSLNYFLQDFKNNGGKLIEGISANAVKDLQFDYLIYFGVGQLNIPKIDSRYRSPRDLNLSSGCLNDRGDIRVLGDASGLLGAAEAEFQARWLINSWYAPKSISNRSLSPILGMPVRFHGPKSLAMVGDAKSWLAGEWRSIDFAWLGWNAVHQTTGKLWYQYEPKSQKVTAIHICHANASELIGQATCLMALPVTDFRWTTSSVHPSSSEIFKCLVDDIFTKEAITFQRTTEKTSMPLLISLPNLSDLHQNAFFSEWFDPNERKLGVLDPDPIKFFSILLGLKHCLRESEQSTEPLKFWFRDGDYRAENLDFSYRVEGNTVEVSTGGVTSLVQT